MAHDRREERMAMRARLETGASILMLAPRRIGKTWLLHKIKEDMKSAGWTCILADVEGRRTEDEFLFEICRSVNVEQDLIQSLVGQVKQRINQVMADSREGNIQQAVGKIDPRSFLETLVSSLNDGPKRTLILVDEIALFVLERAQVDPSSAKALLYHLRKLQQSYPRVQWFLTGSVGLDAVAKRHDMGGALVEFDAISLSPFNSIAAKSYVEHLCATGQVSHPFVFGLNAFEQLVEELGWLSPYYLRQIALLIRPSTPGDPMPTASPADVSQAAQQLLSSTYQMHFSPWREHIRKNFIPADTARLRTILDEIARDNTGRTEEFLFNNIVVSCPETTRRQLKDAITILVSDGYIIKQDEKWYFQSALLRRYWQEYESE